MVVFIILRGVNVYNFSCIYLTFITETTLGGIVNMKRVDGVSGSNNTEHTRKKSETTQTETTQPKDQAADVKETKINTERASELKQCVSEDGVYKNEHGQTSVGELAKAMVADEEGNVNPEDTKAAVVDMVANNPTLAAKAAELGIDLENPTADDLQKLGNLEIKAGQEVNVGGIPKKAKEAQGTEEAAPGRRSCRRRSTSRRSCRRRSTSRSKLPLVLKKQLLPEKTEEAKEGQAQSKLGKIMEKSFTG